MLTGIAGTDKDGNVFSFANGEEIDVAEESAKRLLETGQAEPVAVKPQARAEKRTSPRAATAETR